MVALWSRTRASAEAAADAVGLAILWGEEGADGKMDAGFRRVIRACVRAGVLNLEPCKGVRSTRSLLVFILADASQVYRSL